MDYGFSEFDPSCVGHDRARANSYAFSLNQEEGRSDRLRKEVASLKEENERLLKLIKPSVEKIIDELKSDIESLKEEIKYYKSSNLYVAGAKSAISRIAELTGLRYSKGSVMLDASYFYHVIELAEKELK